MFFEREGEQQSRPPGNESHTADDQACFVKGGAAANTGARQSGLSRAAEPDTRQDTRQGSGLLAHTAPLPHLAHRVPGRLRRRSRSAARVPPAPRRTRGRAGAPLHSQGAPARPRRRLLHNTAGALRSHGPGTRGPAPAPPHSHRTRENCAAGPEGKRARPGRPRGASSPAEPGSAQGTAAAA